MRFGRLGRLLQALVLLVSIPVTMLGFAACKPACASVTLRADDGDNTSWQEWLKQKDGDKKQHTGATPGGAGRGGGSKAKPSKKCSGGSSKGGASNKSGGKNDQERDSKMWGANGTQIIFSKPLANGKVGTRTWRIDVENPAPGVRPGSLHVQLNDVTGATRYEYARGGKFKTKEGEKLPSKIQNDIDNDPEAQTGIRKGLKILNEKW